MPAAAALLCVLAGVSELKGGMATVSELEGHMLRGLRAHAVAADAEALAAEPDAADAPPLRLRLFTEAQAAAFGARTLDGSPSGYYYREGAEKESFVVFLQGGGLCVEPIDCIARSKGALGSSK